MQHINISEIYNEETQKQLLSLVPQFFGEEVTVINYSNQIWGMSVPSYQWVSGKLTGIKRDNEIWEDFSAGYTLFYEDGTAQRNSSVWNRLISEYSKVTQKEADEMLVPHGYVGSDMGVILGKDFQILWGIAEDNVREYVNIFKATGILIGGSEGAKKIENQLTDEDVVNLLNSPHIMQNEETMNTLLEIWERKKAA